MTPAAIALASAQAIFVIALVWLWRREQQLRKVVARASAELGQNAAGAGKRQRRALAMLEQVEPLVNLYAMVRPERPMPHNVAWAAAPDLLLVLADLVRTRRPSLVIECGSGVSTLWLALALRRFGVSGRIVSLEHQARFATRTTAMLEEHDLTSLAEVRPAPLEPIEIDGTSWLWYARRSWEDLVGCELLFVDGPPQKIQPLSRFPALPLLRDALTDDCVVVLDDGRRASERAILERWSRLEPGLVEQDLELAKGAVVLARGSMT